MTPDLDPLSPDIEALFDAERRYEPESALVKERVLSRVARSATVVGLGLGASHAGTHAAASWLSRLGAVARTKAFLAVGALAVGGAVGGTAGYRAGVTRGSEEARRAPVISVAPLASQVPVAVPSVEPVPTPTDLAPPTSAVASAHGPRASSSASPHGDSAEADDFQRELALVQMSRTAIARGNFDGALAASDQHARQFPNGHLAEERESLAIQALAGAGRGDEARARATRFRAKYPHSLLLPAVEAALRTIP